MITEAYIDDIKLPTDGTTTLEVEKGNHRVVYSYANVNGFGMYLNEKTVVRNIVVEKDSSLVIFGGYFLYE